MDGGDRSRREHAIESNAGAIAEMRQPKPIDWNPSRPYDGFRFALPILRMTIGNAG
jgi:hypothetical protein